MHAPRQETWQEKFKRSRYLIAAILFHLILFLLIATLVIWPAPTPTDIAFRKVTINQPPPPPPPPPPMANDKGGNPVAASQTVIAPVVTPPSLITSQNTSFTVDVSPLDQTLTHFDHKNGNSLGGDGGGFGNGPTPAEQLMTQFSNLLFQLPCLSLVDPHTAKCPLTDDHSYIAHIPDDKVHTLHLHVRGIVELAHYDGGKKINERVVVGGSPSPSGDNIYQLSVSDPPQTYYLNDGDKVMASIVIDYPMEIQVKNNSTVTLHADSVDSLELPNSHDLSAPDHDPKHPIAVKQPYDGEFIQIDTVGVDNSTDIGN